MTVKISHSPEVQQFFKEASGFQNDQGSSRMKTVTNRILADAAKIIEDLEISQDEFWKAVDYLNRLGGRNEAGLLVAGLIGTVLLADSWLPGSGSNIFWTCSKMPRTLRSA